MRLWSLVAGVWQYIDYTYSIGSAVTITVTSAPTDLSLTVDGAACTAPCTFP